MKRERYLIQWVNIEDGLTNQYQSVRFAWNASIREIEKQIRSIALKEGTYYNLIAKLSERSEEGDIICGYRTWKCSKTDKEITFNIQKVA